jgi:TRAP-type transport system small permease protein
MNNQSPVRNKIPIDSFGRAAGALSMAALVIMMLLTVVDVLLRYTLNRPILGSTEITELIMVPMAFAAIIWCTASKAHLHVDLLDRISPKIKNVLDIIFYFLYVALFSLMAWRTLLEALRMMPTGQSSGETTRLLSIPEYPFYMLISLACAIIVLLVLVHIWTTISLLTKKRD